MDKDSAAGKAELLSIQLMGTRTGIPVESLIPSLQRVFPRKTEAQIREALNRLPVLLIRGVNREQALKVKRLLEANGAVLEIRPLNAPRPAPAPAPGREAHPPPPGGVKGIERRGVSAGPGEEGTPPGAERRKKPRVHPGFDIRPMGIGDILDRSFKLLYKYFWLFFIILFIPQGCLFLIQKAVQIAFVRGMQPPPGLAAGLSILIALPVFLVLQFWAQGALIYAVSETYLGHITSIKGAFGAMRRLIWKLLGTMILWGICVFGPFILIGIFAAILIPLMAAAATPRWLIGLVVVIAVVVCIWLFFRLLMNWLLVDKVVVLEATGGIAALRRSKELMAGRTEKGFGKSFKTKGALIILVGLLLVIGIQLVFEVPMTIAQFATRGSMIVLTIHQVLKIAADCLGTVFTAIAMILFYYDIRLRKEGFDLRMMAENL